MSRIPSLQSLSQPVREFALAQLRQVVDTLFAEINPAQVDILCGRLAAALDDNCGISLEDDAIVDNFVDRQRDEVVVLDYRAPVDGLLEQQM